MGSHRTGFITSAFQVNDLSGAHDPVVAGLACFPFLRSFGSTLPWEDELKTSDLAKSEGSAQHRRSTTAREDCVASTRDVRGYLRIELFRKHSAFSMAPADCSL